MPRAASRFFETRPATRVVQSFRASESEGVQSGEVRRDGGKSVDVDVGQVREMQFSEFRWEGIEYLNSSVLRC